MGTYGPVCIGSDHSCGQHEGKDLHRDWGLTTNQLWKQESARLWGHHSFYYCDIPSFAGHHLVGRFNPCGILGFWGSHVSRRRKGASDTPPFRLPGGIPSTRNVQVQWETDEHPGESCIGCSKNFVDQLGNQHEASFFGRIWETNLYKLIIFTVKHDI